MCQKRVREKNTQGMTEWQFGSVPLVETPHSSLDSSDKDREYVCTRIAKVYSWTAEINLNTSPKANQGNGLVEAFKWDQLRIF